MHSTLKMRLLFSSLTAVLVTVITLVGLTTYFIRHHALIDTQEKIDQLAITFAGGVGQWMEDKKSNISSLKSIIEADPEVNVRLHLLQTQNAARFGSTFFGSEAGVMMYQDAALDNANLDPRTRPWYLDAKAAGTIAITAPYISSSLKKQVVTIAEPVMVSGRLHGVVAANLTIEQLTDAVLKLKVPGDGYGIMVQKTGLIISHPDKALNEKQITDIDRSFTLPWLAQTMGTATLTEHKLDGATKLVYTTAIPHTDWALIFVMGKQEIMAQSTGLAWIMSFAGGALMILFGIILIAIFKLQFRDLERVAQALNNIAEGEGDLTVSIKTASQHDEIGILASGFNRFVSRLHGMISRMHDIAGQLEVQAKSSSNSAMQTSQRIEVQQDEVTMVATAVTEMAAATEEIASNADHTAQTAQDAVGLSEHGKQQVTKSQTSIRDLAHEVETAGTIIGELNAHSQKISSILSTISGIAEQTNLLALNAAIEAARAGDQGRGFAVVADEVRVLSQRTHSSTQEIQTMIETLQQTAAKAVKSMTQSHQMAETSVSDAHSASESLVKISQAIHEISGMAIQIATAAEEQTSVTSEINRNTESIRTVSESLSTEAQAAKAQAQELANLAASLQQEVGRFKL
ncbi:methyl-accepting chemotaxis sensory transducer with Cache sensor [Rheinheimera pacifica]|uniref:Methyl-accepting chemotaxis sensory transducer with Cache sensor n=1 Tax=Rheinheimera pacifica TaxID=173990 RepID=A0A1H6JX73_9GAMM|nr:methyl-accepting chemotaxis protein [Rheinheimera pacifica]SEH63899.1 methyl-accepting chemotaxis sensory transducer with Cache sensor [Rheinheimera pacifica]